MNRREFVTSMAALPLAARIARAQQSTAARDYPIAPVSQMNVEVTDSFWSPRIEAARTVSLPLLLDDSDKHNYQDTRIIEGAYYFLAQHPDAALKERIDSKLDSCIEQVRRFKGKWPAEADGSTIAGGDFILAAIAHHQTTGSRKMLDVALEISDDMNSFFGPDKKHPISNHECIEMALTRLYLATGNEKCLRLAKFFVDERGNWKRSGRASYGSYAQDHVPVKEQTRAIGHCVRATYLYMGVTEVAAFAPDSGYAEAIERIWQDAVSKRTYLTGGIGSYRHHENYGDDYDLPNLNCWNEVCAACGTVWWNHRLFLMTGDS
ncbi:MAG TPA: beta-L-arabinofuranosidase domain-containing protein, partial [Terriglobia bacterium]|nr:beta-L-arabinofuranosidase domain-containing protein [Terriglobia bacterium]